MKTFKKYLYLSFFLVLLENTIVPPAVQAESGLAIERVSASQERFDPVQNERVVIRFHLPSAARVALDIYDSNNSLVRSIKSSSVLQAGDHALDWDGRDWKKRKLPPEVYVYTLTATNEQNERVVWDLTDVTGGEPVVVRALRYDNNTGTFTYELEHAARIFLRLGVESGPLLNTLVNAELRTRGKNTELWDGWDNSGMVLLKDHPKLEFHAEGMRLPRNALVITGTKPDSDNAQRALERHSQPKRNVQSEKMRVGLYAHAYHDREVCRDGRVTLTLDPGIPRDKEGVPIITGPTNFRVTMDDADALAFEGQRFEVVFFLNNRMTYENEISFLPYTWKWDPKVAAEGVHYMTAEVVGFEKHFAVTTLKFRIVKKDTHDNG